MLRGAVLGLQDGGDGEDAAEASPEPAEEPPGEEQPCRDETDDGPGPQSPRKQEQSQHLHLMVELLRPQDDIRLVRGLHPRGRARRGPNAASCLSGEPWCEGRGHPGECRVTQTPTTLLFQPELF